jgi:peptide/nickel transport system permease protein
MNKLVRGYLIPRIGQYLTVIFIGVSISFFIPRLSPNDPVENQINLMIAQGDQFSPEAIDALRSSLTALYGLEGGMWRQYFNVWARLFRGDLGPSLSVFPTPVTELIFEAMPWTLGLLLSSIFFSWVIGNLLGGLASYYPDNLFVRTVGVISQTVRPIPYYIMALLLLMFFGFFFPIFPLRGAYPLGVRPEWTLKFALTVIHHSILPVLSLVIIGAGGWFLGMKSLTSNIISEDYVVYAETTGLRKPRILFQYIIRNALLPQVTGLALQIGMIFNGSLIMEVVFSYPGIGLLLYRAVTSNDYSLIMGITIFSIIGVATTVLIIDLLYPLLDPRVRYG